MTGPPLPRPVAGSNAIGSFVIGVSPVGTIPAFDVWSTIISQYANSPILTQLITNFFQYIDQTADFEAFFDNIWNIDTAQGYGLDVWGRIVGVTRNLQLPTVPPSSFGFAEANAGTALPFGFGVFFTGQGASSSFTLDDNDFRTLIFAKALANISDGSIKSINQLLLNLFPNRGNCFVVDGLNMTMEYVFSFPLSTVELAILGQSGVLPKPTGVAARVVQV